MRRLGIIGKFRFLRFGFVNAIALCYGRRTLARKRSRLTRAALAEGAGTDRFDRMPDRQMFMIEVVPGLRIRRPIRSRLIALS
jgi:hypothetical protein